MIRVAIYNNLLANHITYTTNTIFGVLFNDAANEKYGQVPNYFLTSATGT